MILKIIDSPVNTRSMSNQEHKTHKRPRSPFCLPNMNCAPTEVPTELVAKSVGCPTLPMAMNRPMSSFRKVTLVPSRFRVH
jgi:hypothetical protein